METKSTQEGSCHGWACCCSKEGAMWWGVILFILGLLFIGDDLGWYNLGVSLWAVVIAVIGLVMIIWSAMKR